MNLIAAIFAIIFLSASLAATLAKSAKWAPTILHNFIWSLALAIIASGIMNYTPLTASSWLILLIAWSCFNFGVAATSGRGNVSSRAPESTAGVSRKTHATLLLLFTVGFLIYLVTIARSFGLSTLISNPAAIRSSTDVSYLSQFPLPGKILFYLGPLAFVITATPSFQREPLKRIPQIGLLAYLALAQLAVLQRTNLFVCLAWLAGVGLYRLMDSWDRGEKTLSPRQMFGAFLVVLVGATAFQGIAQALGKTAESNDQITSYVKPSWQASPFITSFHYLSSGPPAFSRLEQSRNPGLPPAVHGPLLYGDYNPLLFGQATFSGPMKLLPLSDGWSEVSPFTTVPEPTNVYTWVEPWYRDLRAPGVALGAISIGLLIGTLSRKRGQSRRTYLMGSYLLGLTLFAPFINRYMTVMSISIYVAIFFVTRPPSEPNTRVRFAKSRDQRGQRLRRVR